MDMRRFLDLFLAESREHICAGYELHARLQKEPDELPLWRELFRHAHSLKGMAASMRYDAMVDLSHALEDLMERMQDGPGDQARDVLPLLGESMDCLVRIVDQVEKEGDSEFSPARSLAARLRAITGDGEAPGVVAEPAALEPDANAQPDMAQANAAAERPWWVDLKLKECRSARAENTVKILGQIAKVGKLIQANPPMLSMATGRFEGRLTMRLVSGLSRDHLQFELQRIEGVSEVVLRELEPPADLPAVDAEPVRWLRVRADQLDLLMEHVLDLRLQQERLRSEISEEQAVAARHAARSESLLEEIHGQVLELRLVSFESTANRLQHAVRELAQDLKREVDFDIEGGSVPLDRAVLEALVDPLIHMVRNALDHGIEAREERLAGGKPVRGVLRLTLERRGDRVRILLQDDGRGICPERIKSRALELGMIDEKQARTISPREALLLTTQAGFTTARRVSKISGRGVGLDVVRENVERLGGTLEMASTPGQGTDMLLSVPLSLARIQALMVRCAGELFALPMALIHKSVSLRDRAIYNEAGREQIKTPEGALDLLRISTHLGLPTDEHGPAKEPWALQVALNDCRVALAVDEILGRKDIVVKPLQIPLAHLREYSGAALMEDGGIALVLDPYVLAESRR